LLSPDENADLIGQYNPKEIFPLILPNGDLVEYRIPSVWNANAKRAISLEDADALCAACDVLGLKRPKILGYAERITNGGRISLPPLTAEN